MVKQVLFLRHGQSWGNINSSRQGLDSVLTEKGRHQARAVADRLKGQPPDILVSSPLPRARETAEILSVTWEGKPIAYSDLFVERRPISALVGRPKDDPAVVAIEKEARANFYRSDYRHSDEENLSDCLARAAAAWRYVESLEAESVLVVTHGFFLRFLVGWSIWGEGLTGEMAVKLIRGLKTRNTGLSVFYSSNDKSGNWQLLTWNDHYHLLEDRS